MSNYMSLLIRQTIYIDVIIIIIIIIGTSGFSYGVTIVTF